MTNIIDTVQSRFEGLPPLYHSYQLFGVNNPQLPGNFESNQKCKQPIISAYIQYAIAKCRKSITEDVSFAELFCADGYYAMLARHLGATKCTGIDNMKDDYFAQAGTIRDALGLDKVEFINMDVHDIDNLPKFDIVANVGGLYHVEDPVAVLHKSYDLANEFLIAQTVVSIANDDPDYLSAPAPGWDWGSRFSAASFQKLLKETGWNIIDTHFNELEGNDRLEDRGSCYALIKK